MKRLVLAALILTTAVGASAQFTSTDTLKYRISLTDKAATTYSIQQPEEFLSRKSIDRRLRQKLAIDSTDLPVCKKYVDAIRKKGVHVLVTGKWDNFVTVSCNDSMLIDEIAKLPFVRSTEKVWQGKVSAVTKRDSLINDPQRSDSLYGPAITQIEMSRANLLHDAGFKGQGMTIAVIDAGQNRSDEEYPHTRDTRLCEPRSGHLCRKQPRYVSTVLYGNESAECHGRHRTGSLLLVASQ